MKKVISLVTVIFIVSCLTAPQILAVSSQNVPDYSNTERKDVPEEYRWRIEDIYPSVEAWEKDKELFLKRSRLLTEKAKDWTSSAKKMLEFRTYVTELEIMLSRLIRYASLRRDMEMENPKFRQMMGEVGGLIQTMYAPLGPVEKQLLQLGEKKFKQYLKEEPRLKPYEKNTLAAFRDKAHRPSETQQKLLRQIEAFTDVPRAASRALIDLDIPAPKVTLSDGKEYTLSYMGYKSVFRRKNRADRQLVTKTYYENLGKFENTFAILFDGAMKTDVFHAGIRNYKTSLERRMKGEGLNSDIFLTTIRQVRENLEPFHRYLKLKKELLGLETLEFTDAFITPLPATKEYTFQEAQQMVLASVEPLGKEYAGVMKMAFDNRWMDRYPHKGKRKFGYNSDVYGVHPYVLLTFTGAFHDVHVMIHELGHSMHSWFTNKYQHFEHQMGAGMLAETAAHFNELLLLSHLMKKEDDDLNKLFVLDKALVGIFNAIYNQVRYAEFEHAMHREAEAGNTLSAAWLNKKFMDLNRFYYGEKQGICKINSAYKYGWMDIPHFFMNYYVISYANGMIAAMALNDMVENGGEKERTRYITFLSSGRSDTPLNLLKNAGVDMQSPQTYEAAFRKLNQLVTEMENTTKKLKASGKL